LALNGLFIGEGLYILGVFNEKLLFLPIWGILLVIECKFPHSLFFHGDKILKAACSNYYVGLFYEVNHV
jgi:hypothetical protein